MTATAPGPDTAVTANPARDTWNVLTRELKPVVRDPFTLIFSLVLGLMAALGVFLSGFLADRLGKRFPTALSWMPALGMGIQHLSSGSAYPMTQPRLESMARHPSMPDLSARAQ